MRILAELPHPDFKVSIFTMNQKFIVKLEQGNLEQTYKISELDLCDGVNDVFKMLDETFFQQARDAFQRMRSAFTETYKRHEL